MHDKHSENDDKNNEILAKLTSLAKSFEKIADIYFVLNRKKILEHRIPKKSIFKRFWYWIWHSHKNSRHFGTYALIGLSMYMLYSNWQADLANTRYNQIERVVEKKEERQREIIKTINKGRVFVINQIILCPETKFTKAELKVQRNNMMEPIVTAAIGTQNIFNKQVYDKIVNLGNQIDSINDVCQLNAKEFDDKTHVETHEINELMNKSIVQDKESMNKIMVSHSHEHLSLPDEIKI